MDDGALLMIYRAGIRPVKLMNILIRLFAHILLKNYKQQAVVK